MQTRIDYDADFQSFFENWYAQHKEEYEKPEEIEGVISHLYTKWMQGVSGPLMEMPGEQLVELMVEYITAGEDVPDLICKLIVRRKSQTEQALFKLYNNNMFTKDKQVLLVNMLSEMDSILPVDSFVRIVARASQEDEMVNTCAEALVNTTCEFLEYALEEYAASTSVSSRELLLNALVGKYKDARLFAPLQALYTESENKAFVAAMMGEYGDDRCLPILQQALFDKAINYVDYTEICNAIEMLGGEVIRNREFNGDTYYEMMRQGIEQ